MKHLLKPQRHNIKSHSRSNGILSSLIEPLELTLMEGVHPSMMLRYGIDGTHEILQAKEKRLRRQAFERLRQKQLIKIKRGSDRYCIALTKKGMQEAFRLRVLGSDLFDDDRICMVVFDIPESKRSLRRSLREFLSRAGFAPLQKSVWISPFDASAALFDFFRMIRVLKWIRIYTISEKQDVS